MMLSAILPCYNEEENLKRVDTELIAELDKLKIPYEIIAVDDGSKDNTWQLLQDLAKNNPEFKIVKHDGNKGLGMAVRTGIKNCAGDLIITLDADFTFHPRDIQKLLEKYKETAEADCIIGSHFGKGGSLEKVPFYRIFLSKGVNILYAILFFKKISSVSSIFRLYRASPLKEINLTSTSFDINAEILFKLIQKNRRIAETPVTLTTRIYGVSKLNNLREIKNHLKLLTKILLWRLHILK